MKRISIVGFLLVSAAASSAGTARAHFRLLKPASWIEESDLGDPQKFGPCGTDASDPGTPTNAVTTYRPGETITVEWVETIAHPGHFRIALARDRSELVDPDIETDGFCNYEPGAVSSESPEYPVLMDNLFPRQEATEAGQMFSVEVTLPNEECENCTLQVIQFMTEHFEPCIYYHCATISIVNEGSAPDAGAGGTGAGGMEATAGTGGAGGTTEPVAGTGGAMPTAGSGAPAGSAGQVAMDPGATRSSSSCAASRSPGGALGSVVAMLAALLLVRRRTRRSV